MPSILTPTGYRDIADIMAGDEVSAFDMDTGAPVTNTVESVSWVDYAEWVRWHENAELPPFTFYRINDTWTLNSEQSIWRNGTDVCHVKHLVVGDEIYDDTDSPVAITSIEEVTVTGWWRFDISGDHSYIVDGLTLHNASRFWVSGTGTWDLSDTSHWASSSGGSSGASAPGSADTCTFDGSSGGGTVTPSYGGTGTFQSITCGAFTGTIDWSANNNSVTLTATGGFSATGSGTRTINLGNGTWTLNSTAGPNWNIGTTTNLTFNANSSTISFTGDTANVSNTTLFAGGALTYATLQRSAQTHGGVFSITGINTFTTLTLTGANACTFSANQTITTFNVNGTSSGQIHVTSNTDTNQRTLTITTLSATWVGWRNIIGSGTSTNSFDLGGNSGITITPPGGGINRNASMTGGFHRSF